MTETESWAWYPGTVWPGFDALNQSNLSAAWNGLSIDPATITGITWNDANSDDTISDSDTDDATNTGGETVTIAGVTRTVKEVANFTGSTMVVNGTPMTLNMAIWLFEDGTWMMRIGDAAIPSGVHYTAVDSLTLGTFDGTDYSGSFVSTRDAPFICFTAGTLIHALRGQIAVEELRPGDLVLTADHGFRPVRWIGARTVTGQGAGAPVRIAAGALGNDRDLVVSRQHRILVSGWKAELYAGDEEVLVPACHLVNGRTIREEPCDSVTYVHILFDDHEIVFAEGIATESFHPGAVGMGTLDAATREEILALFPELGRIGQNYGPTARRCATGMESRAIAAA